MLERYCNALPLMFIITAVFGAGIGIYGHFMVDEFVVTAILASSIIFSVVGLGRSAIVNIYRENSETINTVIRQQSILFIFFLYYGLQAVRSFLIDHDIKHLLFGSYYFYLILATAFFGTMLHSMSSVHRERLLHFAVWSIVAYNLIYLAQGFGLKLYGELFAESGFNRFSSQGHFWSGSAYATFPSLFGVLLSTLVEKQNHLRNFALTASVLCISLMYDSRVAIAIFILATFATIVAYQLTLKSVSRIAIVSIVIFALANIFVPLFKVKLLDAAEGTTFLTKPRIMASSEEGDYDRHAHFHAGYRGIKQDVPRLLFGHGNMQHRALVGQHIYEIIAENPILQRFLSASNILALKERNERLADKEIPLWDGARTTTYTSLILDGGLVGIFLFLASLLVALIAALRHLNERGRKYTQSVVLVGVFISIGLWTLLINVTTMTLFWLSISLAFHLKSQPQKFLQRT